MKLAISGYWIRGTLIVLLATTMGTSFARAQTSALSSAASSVSAAQASPAAGQATTFVGLIQQIPALCAACKAKFCASCCGQMLQSMLTPLSMATGGCVTCCPPVSKSDLANPGAAGACALIVQDTLDAQNRVAAVECLASVDCRYWPEAEKQLISSLRADKNEGVRLAAALVLGGGCCCTKNTIEALTLSVEGGDKDGNPIESSRRVRAAAATALQHCLACYTGPLSTATPPETPVPPEVPPVPAPQEPAPPTELRPARPRRAGAAVITPVPEASIASVTTKEVPTNPQAAANTPITEVQEPLVPTTPAPNPSSDDTIIRAQRALEANADPIQTPTMKSGDRSIAGIFRAARRSKQSNVRVTEQANAVTSSVGNSAPQTIPIAQPAATQQAYPAKPKFLRFFR